MNHPSILLSALCVFLMATVCSAEFYLGPQVGLSIPKSLDDTHGTGSNQGLSGGNLRLQNSIVYGWKLGYFLPSYFNWLGIELNAYSSRPNIKQQPGLAVFNSAPPNTSGALMSVNTGALDVVLRYPGDRVQPYIGAGVGGHLAIVHGVPNVGNDIALGVGLNAMAGLRVFVSEKIALFAEYKVDRAHLRFQDFEVEGKYRPQIMVAGVTLHLGRVSGK